MKERPILFKPEMVRAILDGTKTQTRRIVKHVPMLGDPAAWCAAAKAQEPGWVHIVGDYRRFCKQGSVGDKCWVREEHYCFGHWEPVPGQRTMGGRQKWKFVNDGGLLIDFEPPAEFRKGRHHKDPSTSAWHKRLARFMPRKFSRITLEITSIRVERLRDISEADAIAEGIELISGKQNPKDFTGCWRNYDKSEPITYWNDTRDSYRSLWTSINGECSWEANPWVWAITFKRVPPCTHPSGIVPKATSEKS